MRKPEFASYAERAIDSFLKRKIVNDSLGVSY